MGTKMTIREAARSYADGFSTIPTATVEGIIASDPHEWKEVTKPAAGGRIHINGMEESCSEGTIRRYDAESGLYEIALDDGSTARLGEDAFSAVYCGGLPAWGTMWSFSEGINDWSMDDGDWWLAEGDGIRKMSDIGFRIYRHGRLGYFFGVDCTDGDFLARYWVPLYEARGLHWHEPGTDNPGRNVGGKE